MINTDGKPTIANGAGDPATRSVTQGGIGDTKGFFLPPETEPQSPQEAAIERAWDYGAGRALNVFADSLQDILNEGGTLTLEEVVAAAREIAGELNG